MKIYIDSQFKCHAANSGGLREFELSFFKGKCPAFIEGYRYVPPGETWRRADGELFSGEMIAPWQNYLSLYMAQLEYELELARQHIAAAEVAADA